MEQGQHGTVSEWAGKWTYRLSHAIDSGDIQGANTVEGADSVKLKVTDGAGHEWTIDVPVDIVDAVPTAASEGSYELEPGRQANGTLGSIDYGKDGKGKFVVEIDGEEHEVDPTAVTDIAGTYGTLKIAMGGYVYTAKSNAAIGTDNFTIRVIDGDGDIAESALIFKVKGNEGPLPPDPDPEPDDPVDYPEPQISATAPITLYESGLRESGAPEGESASQTGHFLVNLFGDDGSIEIEASRYNSLLIEIVNGKSTFDPVKAGVIKSNDIEFKVTGVELQADGQWKVSYACELPESGYFDRYGEPKAAELDIPA